MDRITISQIFCNKTKKDGTPLITKTGKPYISVTIYAKENGGTKLSGFAWNDTDPVTQWKAGEVHDVIIEQKGQYVNFRLPKKEDLFEDRIAYLEQKVNDIEVIVKGLVNEPKKEWPGEIHGTESALESAFI